MEKSKVQREGKTVDKIELLQERDAILNDLTKNGFGARLIDPNAIEPKKSWVPGNGGFHNSQLRTAVGNPEESWKPKFQELLRWQARLLLLSPVDDNNLADVVDFLHSFCLSCFHLKDYLEVSKNLSLNDMNCALFWFPEFLICRDVANGVKHLDLDYPSISRDLGFHHEWDPFKKCQIIRVTVYIGGEMYSYSHLEFMQRCVKIWLAFLKHRGFANEASPS